MNNLSAAIVDGIYLEFKLWLGNEKNCIHAPKSPLRLSLTSSESRTELLKLHWDHIALGSNVRLRAG